MALLKCKDCGKEFSDSAAACPSCGRPLAVPLMKRKFGCGGCLVLCVVGLFVVMMIGKSSTPTPQDATARDNANLEYEGRVAVKATLKDPESATFRDVIVVRKPGSIAVCGYINAKNGFGGYTGFKQFMARGSLAMVRSPESDREFVRVWNKACVT